MPPLENKSRKLLFADIQVHICNTLTISKDTIQTKNCEIGQQG